MAPHTVVTDIQSLTDKSFMKHGISNIKYELSWLREFSLEKGFEGSLIKYSIVVSTLQLYNSIIELIGG